MFTRPGKWFSKDQLDPKRRWDPDALDVDEIVEEMLLAEEAEAEKAGKTWVNWWKFENANGSMENMENMEMKWWWELCTNCRLWLPEIVKKIMRPRDSSLAYFRLCWLSNLNLIEGNQARFLSQLPSGRATSVGGGGEAPPWRGRAAPRGRGDMFAEGGWISRVPKDQETWPEIFIWGPCFACLWCWLCH